MFEQRFDVPAQCIPESTSSWEQRLRRPEVQPSDGREYIRLTITDGHRYQHDVWKHEDDMLWPEVHAYNLAHPHWRSEAIILWVRGSPINPYQPLGSTFLQNGDTIQLSLSTADILRVDKLRRLLHLSPLNKWNVPYVAAQGPCTREDESTLRIDFESIWPNLPSVHLKCRARDDATIGELILILSEILEVPHQVLRVTHEGLRADGEIGQYRVKARTELEVHMELLGGGQLLPLSKVQQRPHPPQSTKRSIIEHPEYIIELDTSINLSLRHAIEYLSTITNKDLKLYSGGKIVDLDTPLSKLEQDGNITEGEARMELRDNDPNINLVPPSAKARFRLFSLPVVMEGEEKPTICVVPYEGTIKAWYQQQGGDENEETAFFLEGTRIRGNPTFNDLDLDDSPRLEIRRSFPHPEVVQRGKAYDGMDYVGSMTNPPTGYVTIRFHVRQQTIVTAHVTPVTPFRAILDYVYQQFGLSLQLRYQGSVLDEDDTPGNKNMEGVTRVHAGTIYEQDHVFRNLPQRINVIVTHFHLSTLGPTVYGRILPISVTIPQAWRHEFGHFCVPEPRFLLDGERIPDSYTLENVIIEDDSYIEVVAGQTGGGPPEKRLNLHDESETDNTDPSSEGTGSSNPQHFAFLPRPTAEEPIHKNPLPEPNVPSSFPPQSFHPFAYPAIATPRHPNPIPFEGTGVDNFFQKYDAWCNSFRLGIKARFEGLYFYLSDQEPHNVLSYAQKLPEWEQQNYEGIKAELLKAFQEDESDRYTLTDLHIFVSQSRTINTLQDLNRFIIAFKEMANTLKKYDRITEEQYKECFLHGIGKKVRDNMRRKEAERGPGRRDINYSEIEEDARQSFKAESYYERYEFRAAQEEDRRRNPSHVQAPQLSLSKATTTTSRATMDEVTEALKTLTINMNRMINQPPNQPSYQPLQQSAKNQTHTIQIQPWMMDPRQPAIIGNPPPPPVKTPYQGDPTRQATANVPTTNPPPFQMICHYCGNAQHGKRECQDYRSHLAQGVFIEGPDGRMLDNENRRLPWRPGQMREVALARWNELEGRKTHPQSNHYEMVFDEGENEWPETCGCCDFHRSNNIEAESNEKRKTREDESATDPRSIKAKKNVPTSTQPNVPTTTQPPKSAEDEDDDEMDVIIDQITGTKKRRPPSHHIMSEVEEEFNLNKMATNLLDEGKIQLSLAQACSLNKDLAREVSKRIKPRRIPIIGPIGQANKGEHKPTVHFVNNVQEPTSGPFYTHGLPMLKIQIGGSTFKALLDGGSELDMISFDAAKKIAGDVRNDGEHKVFGIGSAAVKLSGVLENEQLTIGGITRSVHLWVRPGLGYDLLLGMPTIARFNIRQEHEKDGVVWVRLKDDDGRKVKMLAVQPDHPKNRRFLPPRLGRTIRKTDEPSDGTDTSDDE
ncbi:hypothetical protein CF328_g5853 [Tilletia controversa]|nr:hypothetical protein CF328_g5853 [Tilletia controversa]